ncbi:MAG: ORF6N domain-containing protein [Bacteroidia bacterium]|jgi:hypothetical protein
MKTDTISIENKIFTIRDTQVMIDRDLAELYQVETKVLNQAVKRNIERFPEYFRFQLLKNELDELVTICDQFMVLKHSSTLPYAFTEQGVAMLSAVLRSNVAVQISIQIMQSFVSMRRTLRNVQGVIQRIEHIEMKQVQTDSKLETVLKALEKEVIPRQGIFFEGQLFDAHVFVSQLIKKARFQLVLVDNYIDESTLLLLTKRKDQVKCIIYSRPKVSLLKDLEKHNRQYPHISFKENCSSHDRFLIVDKQLYHFGASFKDLGNKCFAFSRMDALRSEIEAKLLEVAY